MKTTTTCLNCGSSDLEFRTYLEPDRLRKFVDVEFYECQACGFSTRHIPPLVQEYSPAEEQVAYWLRGLKEEDPDEYERIMRQRAHTAGRQRNVARRQAQRRARRVGWTI